MAGYVQLLADVQAWAWDESIELASSLPTVVELGEFRLRRELPVLAFDATVSGTFSGGAVIDLPSDRTMDRYFRVYVSGTPQVPLQKKTWTYLDEYWPDSTATGSATYYAQQGTASGVYQIRVAPTPASGTVYEYGYRRQIPNLSTTNSTNWLTSNAYDALLYACLVEAAQFKQDDELNNRVNARYEIAKAGIGAETLASISDDYGGQAAPRARE